MGKQHKHAELIKAWADGAEIEFFGEGTGQWYLVDTPSWDKDTEYRAKPITININGHEVPKPLREPLNSGQVYWTCGIVERDIVCRWSWDGDDIDERLLSRGLIHLTKEAAETHAKALLSFTTQEK